MSDVEPTIDEEEVVADPAAKDEAVATEAATTPEEELDPVAEAEAKAQEYLELAQRKQAEFENFRKRASAQSAQAEARGVSRLAKELLTPLDHLSLAIEHAEEESRPPLASLREEFHGALARLGVESFSPQGEAFDPNLHEAMAQTPVEGAEPGTVAEVYQVGWRAGEAILRPARVVVVA